MRAHPRFSIWLLPANFSINEILLIAGDAAFFVMGHVMVVDGGCMGK